MSLQELDAQLEVNHALNEQAVGQIKQSLDKRRLFVPREIETLYAQLRLAEQKHANLQHEASLAYEEAQGLLNKLSAAATELVLKGFDGSR